MLPFCLDSVLSVLRGRDVDGQFVAGFGPGLTGQHVLDGHVAFLDQPGFRVDDAIPLFLRLDRLAFQDDHPQIALVELAAPLYRLHQLLVVQVAFAEIPADQRPGDGLTLAQRVVRLVVQRTSAPVR